MARESKRKRDERRFGKAERLADAFREFECVPPPWIHRYGELHDEALGIWRDAMDNVRRNAIPYAVPVTIDNIRDFVEKSYWDKQRDITWSLDIPCWMPPFPLLLLEFKPLHRNPLSFDKIGFLVTTLEWASFPSSLLPDGYPEVPHIARFEMFGMNSPSRQIVGPLMMAHVGIDNVGSLAEEPMACLSFSDVFSQPEHEMLVNSMDQMASAFFSLAFMNCKNVAISPVEPPKELNRERKKAGLKPFVRYHTINIEPMKKVLRTEGNIEANGLKKALHIVRGHFTHYSEERPLFGRPGLHGTFWTPAHVRGSLDEGVVISDYNVKAPANP